MANNYKSVAEHICQEITSPGYKTSENGKSIHIVRDKNLDAEAFWHIIFLTSDTDNNHIPIYCKSLHSNYDLIVDEDSWSSLFN